ncbi:MAG: hypothetical protein L0207_01430 [Chlamydiae bacterium]|nr:hypothetical protein [Chlamydiota bacterium]
MIIKLFLLYFFFLFVPLSGAVWTQEDGKRLTYFESHLKEKLVYLSQTNSSFRIPKVIHFIWLGSKKLPENSKKNIQKWIDLHPGWKWFFWTDVDERSPPHDRLEKRGVENFSFSKLGEIYHLAENVGEKAKILAYEILYSEGGLVVDLDVTPIKNFNPLHQNYDFYSALDSVDYSVLTSSIYPSPHLIASAPLHPILDATIDWFKNKWVEIEKGYPGNTIAARLSRYMHRTVWALTEGIEKKMEKSDRSIVFPASFFSKAKEETDCFAIHTKEISWVKEDSEFENRMTNHFEKIIRKDNQTLLVMIILFFMNSLGFLFLYETIRKF